MIPVPKLPTSKKVDFYTQTQSTGPPVLRPVTTKPPKSPSAPAPSGAVAQAGVPGGAAFVSKSSLSKLAEFFGADSEGDVDKLLSHMPSDARSINAGSMSETEGIEGMERPGQGFEEGDGGEDGDFQTKRHSNTPKRAAKLARFFGLPASEDNIGKIRTELRLNSNMNFYRGCIGENVIKINFGSSQFSSSKSLLVTTLTTARECIKILLGKLGIDSDPSKYVILEVSSDQSKRTLKPDECPLQTVGKWNEPKTFLLKKAETTEDDDDEAAVRLFFFYLSFLFLFLFFLFFFFSHIFSHDLVFKPLASEESTISWQIGGFLWCGRA